MSRKSFEWFATLAKTEDNYSINAARYPFMAEPERRIVPDVTTKLSLQATDTVLDIGCGVGQMLIPLSFLCSSVTGVDHPDVLDRLKQRIGRLDNVRLLPGNFLDLKFEGRFDKVLAYSVIHYLSNMDEVWRFIRKALSLLAPGGIMLLGDIPNTSKRSRMIASPEGRAFQTQWEKAVSNVQRASTPLKDDEMIEFNDELILDLLCRIRNQGFDAYLLPQPAGLPCHFTRDDILAVKTWELDS